MTCLLMSLHPIFCEAILRGDKRVEYRTRRPRAAPPLTAFLYATQPEGAILGTVTVADVREGPVPELLALSREEALHDRYRAYLADRDRAAALILEQPKRFQRPLAWGLALPNRRPPQAWCYIGPADADRIEGLADNCA